MAGSVSFEVTLTEEDYLRVITFMQGRQFLHRYLILILFATVFISIWIFILILGTDSPDFSVPLSLLSASIPAIAVSVLVWLARRILDPLFLRRNLSKQFRSSPALPAEQRVTIDDDGLKYESDFGSSLTKWSAFTSGIETNTDLVLYTSPKFSHFVPKRVFESQTDLDLFRSIAKRNMIGANQSWISLV